MALPHIQPGFSGVVGPIIDAIDTSGEQVKVVAPGFVALDSSGEPVTGGGAVYGPDAAGSPPSQAPVLIAGTNASGDVSTFKSLDGVFQSISEQLQGQPTGVYATVVGGITDDDATTLPFVTDTDGYLYTRPLGASFWLETTTPLGASATFQGAQRDAGAASPGPVTPNYFNAFFLADQTGTASIQCSDDGATWAACANEVLAAGTPLILQVPVMARYHRAVLRLRKAGGDGFTLGAGEIRYDANGNIIASSPYKPQLVTGPNGEVIEYTPGGGTAPVDPASVFSRMIQAESGGQQFTNGRPTTSSKGAVGIAQVMPSTGPEAAAAAGLPWDPARFRNDGDYNHRLGQAYFNKLLTDFGGDTRKAVAAYNAGGGRVKAAVAKAGAAWETVLPAETKDYLQSVLGGNAGTGGSSVRVLTPGKADKEQTRVMTPEEVAAIPGLDPNTVYQRSVNGTITPVGGQKTQLKPWPAPALEARTSNNAALSNIRSALSLLDPKNTSNAAKSAREAIGLGTGMLGDTFTQFNDPDGAPFRSQIGQIGGIIIKDTSGAAVSLSEDQRLAKWVPLVTDRPEVARAKLRNLERELALRNQSMDQTYSEDQGYRPFSQTGAKGFRILGVRPKQ